LHAVAGVLVESRCEQFSEDDTASLAVGAGETEISLNRVLPNRGYVRDAARFREQADHVHATVVVMAGTHQAFGENERGRAHHARLLAHLVQHALPIRDFEVLAVTEDTNVRTAHKNFFSEIMLQPVHHSDDDDESADTDEHAADRDDADQ